MAIEIKTIDRQVAVPTYSVSGIPQLEGVKFTNGSSGRLVLPDAVGFASGRNQFLESAQEAVAFRYAALNAGQDGLDGANDYQWSRTAALYFKSEGKWHVAFDDIPDAEKNIILAKSKEGYTSHKANGKFPLSTRSTLVKDALKRAEKDSRIVVVPESRLELLTKPTSGEDSVAGNTHSRAILGYASPLQAEFLDKKGYEQGYLWFITPPDLDKLNLKPNEAEIRAAGLGNDYFSNIDYVNANYRFNYGGRSRGTSGAKKFQRK